MKNFVFAIFAMCVMSLNAQGILVISEAETKSIETFESVMNKWMGALKSTMEMDNARLTVFREMGTRNMKIAQWFDSMDDMVGYMNKQEENQEKIMQAWESSDPLEEGTWDKFADHTNFNSAEVWKYRPELSTTPETYSPLSKEEKDEITYRRVQYFDVKVGMGSAFEADRKKFNEMDKSIGVNFHLAVFENVFGGGGAEYMVILLDKSRFDYHANWQERMKKRNASEEWQAAMNNNNLGNWSVISEANWNRLVSMSY